MREPIRVRAAYVSDLDIAAMVNAYAPRPSPGARLRAVLEGQGGKLVLTDEQQAEVDAIRASWDERGEPS